MATCVAPSSTIVASRACRSGASGVGEGTGQASPAQAGLDGADQPGARPGRRERGLEQVDGRRLAAGAGHAEHVEARRGVAVDPCRGGPDRGTGVGVHEDGDGGLEGGLAQRRAGGPVGVGEDGRGAAGQRVAREVGAVGAAAGQGREEVAGAHLVRTQRGPGEPGVGVADDLHGAGLPQPGDHLGDRHGRDAQGAQRAVLEARAGRVGGAVATPPRSGSGGVIGGSRRCGGHGGEGYSPSPWSLRRPCGLQRESQEHHGSVSGTWRGGAVDTGTAPCWAR